MRRRRLLPPCGFSHRGRGNGTAVAHASIDANKRRENLIYAPIIAVRITVIDMRSGSVKSCVDETSMAREFFLLTRESPQDAESAPGPWPSL